MNPDLFLCVANIVSDAVFMLAADGTIQAVNRKAETLLGLPAKDVVGRPFFDFVNTPADDLSRYLRSCLRSPDIVPGAVTLTTAGGEKLRYRCEGGLVRPRTEVADALMMLRLFPVGATIGHFVALNEKLTALHREVERRRRAEETLRNSESRKSAMLATALDAIITMDHAGRIVEFNPAAEAMFGYSSEQVISQQMAERIIPPDLRPRHEQALRQYLATGQGSILGQRIELTAMRADGSEFPVELAVSSIEGSAHPLFTAYIRDITERKSNLAILQEQLRLAAFGRDVGLALSQAASMRSMLQQCAGLMVQHLEGAFARIWSVNEASRMLELQASAGLYTHIDGNHSRIPVGQYKIGQIAQSQQPHLTNTVVGDPRVHDQAWATREGMMAFAGYPLIVDGRTIGVMAMFARHPLSETTLAAMTSVANGIALGMERKRIEQELRRQTKVLKVVDQKKDEFLAMLAHELRNPLAPIRTGLELLHLDSDDKETIALVQDQVDHLVRLVDDLLDVSRIMRGKITLQKQRVQLTDVLSRAVATVQPHVDQLGHQLLVSQPAAPVWLEADPVRLSQVLSNLLHNAAKYTPHGGRIELEALHHERQVVIRVKDNGVGIDADFLPELFELFTQADSSLDRSVGGLGVGLTIVRRLVELHSGSISVHSEGLGKGSEFRLQLPTVMGVEADPKRVDHPTMTASADTPPCRILVVDDNLSSAKVMRRILGTHWKHEVEVAYNGREALEVAQTFRPDIIFLDIGLPGLNGFEVAKELRQQPAFADIRLVALTGYGSPEDYRKSQEAGFDLHLVKPITAQALRDVIVQCSKR